MCFHSVDTKPGGAEVEISMLFADVRGSTGIAERIPAQEYSKLIARFYGTAADVVDRHDGIVDKFVGDEVVALFVPGFAGDDHAAKAVHAAKELLTPTGNDGGEPWAPVGAGVHTGIAYVGRVGEGDACDFTALGFGTVDATPVPRAPPRQPRGVVVLPADDHRDLPGLRVLGDVRFGACAATMSTRAVESPPLRI